MGGLEVVEQAKLASVARRKTVERAPLLFMENSF
jgi:hypothetical protein